MRTPASFLVILFIFISLSACASPASQGAAGIPAPIILSGEDAGRTISVPAGAEIDLTLQTIGPGEYGEPQLSSEAVRFLDVPYVSPPIPAGPTQLFRFEAVSPGEATITIQGSWSKKIFIVTVEVH
jgi:hypothetical protein